MTRADDTAVERFHATSGRVTGWLTVVVAAGVAIAGILYVDEGFPAWVIAAAALFGAVAWAVMLRPALWVQGDHLVMRNAAETIHIRLAAIEEMAVRQVLAVRAGERRWVSTVVGHSWRRSARSGRPRAAGGTAAGPATTVKYADFVEDRLRLLVDEARAAAGVRAGSREQLALPDAVRRERAWVPIAVIVSVLLGLVLAVLL